jgi:hypothetical protein
MARILSDIYVALQAGITITKRSEPKGIPIAVLTKLARDIYYRDPLLYKQQATVDRYVDDIAYNCSATRKDLNVVSSPA